MWEDPYYGFGSYLFEDMYKEFAEAEETLNRMFKAIQKMQSSDLEETFPYCPCGYQISIGPDGRPRIREFSNVRSSATDLIEQGQIREPLVDTSIDEKEGRLIITAEMPGLAKQDIKVNVSEDHISIHAEKGHKKYHTDIPIDLVLDVSSAKATYTNGILELKIRLKEFQSKSSEVKIE